MSGLIQKIAEAVLVGFLAVAASEVPAHRADPAPRPALLLVVGDPVVGLASRRRS